ncbi:MAG: hypothetical protein AB4426_19250 [Xenococcaceae cyanobacterium]
MWDSKNLVPLRGRQKAKGLHAKVLIGKALMILTLAGYFHRAALVYTGINQYNDNQH